MSSQPDNVFERWIYVTGQQIDALLIFHSYLRAWQSHPLLGHIAPALFNVILDDLERAGLGPVINDKNTRQLRLAVTGQEHKL